MPLGFCICFFVADINSLPVFLPLVIFPHHTAINMDDRELSSRIKALTKALTSEAPPTVIKLLEDLKKDTAPTEEQLRV